MTSDNQNDGGRGASWYVRPAILFTTAYLVIGLIHESAHALTAYALKVPFTFYPSAVDLRVDQSSHNRLAIIGVAGPLCALMVGSICWLFYRWAWGSRWELFLIYLATFGVGTFFGNLMSAAFVGDFSRAAIVLGLPMAARYVASALGFLSLCSLMFAAGWALRRLSPVGSSKVHAVLLMIVIPVLMGTVIVAIAFLPMPSALIWGRLAETVFWIFGAVGLLMSQSVASGVKRTLRVRWVDAAGFATLVIVVRLMASGITFQ